MSTHIPESQAFFMFYATFCNGKLATNSIRITRKSKQEWVKINFNNILLDPGAVSQSCLIPISEKRLSPTTKSLPRFIVSCMPIVSSNSIRIK